MESPSAHDGAYRVQLDVFEGPFDLLLQLIAGRELEVTDVDLADITGDFIRHLADLDDLDLDTATRFLVVAATLLELKAARLLPTTEGDELDAMLAEARDVLYARLLEYRSVRGAADVLRAALVEGMARHARVVALPGALQRLVPDTVLDLAANDLARLASRALAPKPEQHVEIDHIRRTLLSIHVAAEQVLGAVRKAATTFTAVTEGRSREDRVVLFLAILELAKLGRLHLTQRRWDEPIAIEPGDLDGPELLPTADEAPEPMGSP
ncbi:MAG: ScpA family protein [Nitriliruptorales bacterium]|nr:ScpA family protein [Nitriliruptorales bacterium]